MNALSWLALVVGCGLGGLTRAWISAWCTRSFPGLLPLGTLVVNLTGSFLLGLITATAYSLEAPKVELTYLFAATGFCGGLTTFSTLGWQMTRLWRAGQRSVALLFYGVNTLGALVCALLGFVIGGGTHG